MKQKVGVIGLGYVGLPLLAALADIGCEVIGLDVDEGKVESLKQTHTAPIYEPGVTDILQRCQHNIEFTSSYAQLMENCDTIVVTVGTPLNLDDTPNLDHVNDVATTLGQYLHRGQTIILKSTLPPGMTRQLALRMERLSGLKAGDDFYVAFCPERITEGIALNEFHSLPKIIGGINSESVNRAARVIGRLGGKIIRVSSPEVAELVKLVDNCYRAVNVALANEVGHVCEKLSIDAYEVRSAGNDTYHRTNLFRAGLGAGGSCLSKDPQVFTRYADKEGIEVSLIKGSIKANKEATLRPASVVSHFLRSSGIKKPRLSLVGLAFKGSPETDDIRNSPSVDIYHELSREFPDAEFVFHDPIIQVFEEYPVFQTLAECLQGSHVVMFLTNHQALMDINVRDILLYSARPLLIVDCWHNVSNLGSAKVKDVQVFRIGDGSL